jgi:WD40 repeat protein
MNLSIEKKYTFTGHEAPVYSLELLSGDSFLSGGGDKIVCYRKLEEDSPAHGIINTGSTIYSILHIPEKNILLAGLSHGGIHVIDMKLKKEIHFLLYHQNGVFDIKYSGKQKKIIVAGGDGKISFFSSDNFSLQKSISLCNEKIRSVAIDKNENMALVGCGDGTICILDLDKAEIIKRFPAHQSSVNIVYFHPEKDVFLSGGKDAHLNTWSGSNYRLQESIPAHNYAIYSIAFSPSGTFYATGSRDKTIKIWDSDDNRFLARIDLEKNGGHLNSVNKLLWMKNVLLSAGDDRKIIAWRIS